MKKPTTAALVAEIIQLKQRVETLSKEVMEERQERRERGKQLEEAQQIHRGTVAEFATHRAAVLEYFIAQSNCVTRDKTDYMIELAARICGSSIYQAPKPGQPFAFSPE